MEGLNSPIIDRIQKDWNPCTALRMIFHHFAPQNCKNSMNRSSELVTGGRYEGQSQQLEVLGGKPIYKPKRWFEKGKLRQGLQLSFE